MRESLDLPATCQPTANACQSAGAALICLPLPPPSRGGSGGQVGRRVVGGVVAWRCSCFTLGRSEREGARHRHSARHEAPEALVNVLCLQAPSKPGVEGSDPAGRASLESQAGCSRPSLVQAATFSGRREPVRALPDAPMHPRASSRSHDLPHVRVRIVGKPDTDLPAAGHWLGLAPFGANRDHRPPSVQ